MSNPSYIATNLDDLFDQSPHDIQELIYGTEVNNATALLGKIYKIPVSSYVALENIISYVLIGALKPEDTVRAIVDILNLSEEEAYKLASDMEKSIFEKARIKILNKSPDGVVELTFREGRSPDELRKEILDTTKRESAFVKEQASSSDVPVPQEALKETETISPVQPVDVSEPAPAPTSVPTPAVTQTSNSKKFEVAPGSRSQLLEQLQVLGSIPNDAEITERLSKIQQQISSLETKDSNMLETKVPLQQFMFGEKGDEAVEPEMKLASYSKAPTKYNVDPYRETAEES